MQYPNQSLSYFAFKKHNLANSQLLLKCCTKVTVSTRISKRRFTLFEKKPSYH